jgi:hypothetical protein
MLLKPCFCLGRWKWQIRPHDILGSPSGQVQASCCSRRVWMNADAPDVLPSQRPIFESQFLEMRGHQHGRYREVNPLKELVARLIMAKNEWRRRLTEANEFPSSFVRRSPSPVSRINRILQKSTLPIQVRVEQDEVRVSRDGQTSYGLSRASDGERNAGLVSSDVLTSEAQQRMARPTTVRRLDLGRFSALALNRRFAMS